MSEILINGQSSGSIEDVYSRQEIEYFVKYLSILPHATLVEEGNKFTGINKNHQLFNWFQLKIFKKVKDFAGENVNLLFGSYLNEISPWPVHSDYYHKSIGEPYMAFIIPVATDNDIDKVNMTNTVIFNETDEYVDPNPIKNGWGGVWQTSQENKDNNALSFSVDYLSHIPEDDLKKLTVQRILNWKMGSLLYWDERLLHCSDNFLANNIKSKQAIVMHTYVV